MLYLKGGCPSLYVREIINSYLMDFNVLSDFFSCKTHRMPLGKSARNWNKIDNKKRIRKT